MDKVFGIGFHKTGTSSLAQALRQLGYTVSGPDGVHDPDIAANIEELTRARSADFDAFQDNPWPLVYRQMDELYPTAKFVLTLRNPERWIASQVKHFGMTTTPMRQLIYGADRGCPEGNEDHYVSVYTRHNEDVREYFAGRGDKLLVMDLGRGDGWDVLCPFLGRAVPDSSFPRENTAKARDERRKGWKARVRRAVRRRFRQT